MSLGNVAKSPIPLPKGPGNMHFLVDRRSRSLGLRGWQVRVQTDQRPARAQLLILGCVTSGECLPLSGSRPWNLQNGDNGGSLHHRAAVRPE